MLKLCCALILSLFAASACSSHSAPTATGAAPASSVASVQAAEAAPVTPATRAAITATFHTMAPQIKVQSILTSPIPGLYQVIAHGQVFYLTGDGRYVIQGDAYDFKTRTALNNVTMDRLRREAIAKLEPGQMVRYAPPKPRYTVTVFTDIDCPYCRAFHANIAEINKLGIAVDYLFWPRTGLGTPSAQKAVDVWCAGDRQAAMTAAFEGQAPKPAQCASPVAHDFHLGEDLGVGGTPTIIAGNGAVLGGYVDPQELLKRLQQVHAEPTPQRSP
ncbi:MAG TPA: thioredoxin fold domain-containing protein [Rhodanobacteraceae bacterium]|nr:thioredoxin fold domain-containing protein [Rhodanobacteraceae bacterium]